jgi:flagellar motor switch protein FliN
MSAAQADPSNLSNAASPDSEFELNRAIDELRGMAARGGETSPMPSNASAGNNPATLQIPLEVNVILGSTELSLAELSSLKTGSTVKLDRLVGEPLDLVVNGIKIAKGELVLADPESRKFGIRIISLVS